MPRLCGACCGLMVFSAMIVCGLMAGNSAENILSRAIVGLFAGVILGALSGWIGLNIVRDNVETQAEEHEETGAEPVKLTPSSNP
jgi:uncharacterized membrane protein